MTPSRRYGYQRASGLSRRGDMGSRCTRPSWSYAHRSHAVLVQQPVDFSHEPGRRSRNAVLYERDGLCDHGLVAQDPAVAEARGGVKLGLAPRDREALAVMEWNLAILAIVDDEQRRIPVTDQLLEVEGLGVDAVVADELVLEGRAVVGVE